MAEKGWISYGLPEGAGGTLPDPIVGAGEWPEEAGRVALVWRTLWADADATDPDAQPDVAPLDGAMIRIKAGRDTLTYRGAQPVTFFTREIICTIEGDHLVSPAGKPYVILPPTEGGGLSETGWTYTAQIEYQGRVLMRMNFAAPAGNTLDLTLLISTDPSAGQGVESAQAAAAAAATTVMQIAGAAALIQNESIEANARVEESRKLAEQATEAARVAAEASSRVEEARKLAEQATEAARVVAEAGSRVEEARKQAEQATEAARKQAEQATEAAQAAAETAQAQANEISPRYNAAVSEAEAAKRAYGEAQAAAENAAQALRAALIVHENDLSVAIEDATVAMALVESEAGRRRIQSWKHAQFIHFFQSVPENVQVRYVLLEGGRGVDSYTTFSEVAQDPATMRTVMDAQNSLSAIAIIPQAMRIYLANPNGAVAIMRAIKRKSSCVRLMVDSSEVMQLVADNTNAMSVLSKERAMLAYCGLSKVAAAALESAEVAKAALKNSTLKRTISASTSNTWTMHQSPAAWIIAVRQTERSGTVERGFVQTRSGPAGATLTQLQTGLAVNKFADNISTFTDAVSPFTMQIEYISMV